jgi:hypothetical protein
MAEADFRGQLRVGNFAVLDETWLLAVLLLLCEEQRPAGAAGRGIEESTARSLTCRSL